MSHICLLSWKGPTLTIESRKLECQKSYHYSNFISKTIRQGRNTALTVEPDQ